MSFFRDRLILAGLFPALAFMVTSFVFPALADDPAAAIRAGLERALQGADYTQKSLRAKLMDVGAEDWQGFRIVGKELTDRIAARNERRATQEPADLHRHAEGPLVCGVCGAHLFDAEARGSDPAETTLVFEAAHSPDAVVTDLASEWTGEHGKLELRCAICGAHLGHVDPGKTTEAPLRLVIEPDSLEIAESAGSTP